MNNKLLNDLDKLAIQDESITRHLEALKKNSEDYDRWIKLGNTFTERRNYELALQCYEKAISINPNKAEAWNNKGTIFHKLRKYYEAIQCFDRAIEIDSTYDRALRNKGASFYSLDKYEEALSFYNKAIEIGPDFPHVWYNKGLALHKLGKFDEAIKCYDKALEKKPNDADIWYNKGLALFYLGKFDEAIKCYDKALEINPRYTEAYNNKGIALNYLGKYKEALMWFDRAIELDQNSAAKWFNMGQSLFGLEKYDEAIKCYDKALEINPRYTEAYNNKGIALNYLGKYKEALMWFDRAISTDLMNTIGWLNRAYSLFKQGHYKEAEYCYNRVLDIDPEHIDSLISLASLYSDYLYEYEKGYETSLRLLEILDKNNYQDKYLMKKVGITEDLVKIRKYGEARKYGLTTLDEIEKSRKYGSKMDETEVNVYRSLIKFLILCSYMLEGDIENSKKELEEFVTYHKSKNKSIKITEEEWTFNGLINLIKTSNVPPRTEVILNAIIDFLQGRIDIIMLSNNVAINSDNANINNKLDIGKEQKAETFEKFQDLSEGIVEIEEKISDLSTQNVPKIKEDLEELKEKVKDI